MGIICLSLNRIKTFAAIIAFKAVNSFEKDGVVYHKRMFRITKTLRDLSLDLFFREDKSGDIGKFT